MERTVVLTGATGFIAKHVAARLLNAGFRVRATLRTPDRAQEVVAAVRPALDDPAGLDERLRFVRLDLMADEGWQEAMAGADALVHTASPFPLAEPRTADEVVRPAVEGTLRALRAARDAGVGRVVLTSSVAAVMHRDLPPGRRVFDETDWTEPDHPTTTPYFRSKTLAERAAWDFAAREAPGLRLTALNPGLVCGPPLDARYGTSLRLVGRLLAARDPALPQIAFPVVDVRDVAEAHLRALTADGAAGQRFLISAGTLWFHEMAEALRDALPGRRIVTRRAPGALIRLIGLFDPSVRPIVPLLGRDQRVSNARAREVLGLAFIPPREAVAAAGRWLVGNGRA
ncbi:MAG: aldehyde reductase [Rhodobacteraceae bacterium]|nr:aldehyde reductase [Paracoccaceae bacterium]